MKIVKGALKDYKTQITAGAGIAAMWIAFFVDAPVMGEQPLSLGAVLIATIVAAVAIFQRAGTRKAQKAAEAAVEAAKKPVIVPRSVGSVALLLCSAAVIASLSGCFAARARDHILMPAVQLASEGIFEDAQAGVEDAVIDEDMTEAEAGAVMAEMAGLRFAIVEADRQAMADMIGTWEEMFPLVERGINAQLESGMIGPNGALSKLERLANYDESIRKVVEDLLAWAPSTGEGVTLGRTSGATVE